MPQNSPQKLDYTTNTHLLAGYYSFLPARPASDLLEFRNGERTRALAVKLLDVTKHNAANGKVKAHANGICGDKDIGAAQRRDV